jgi:1-phosphofructokinase
MSQVVVFAPSPVLTVTVEDHPDGADIHIHAGGQGVWQARMLRALGASVTMCSVFSGESGRVLHHLLDDEGFDVLAVHSTGRGGAYVHDRRGGDRIKIAETGGEPLSRHDLDALYGLTLRAGLDAGTTILSGPHGESALPADMYRRLASDLRTGGRKVIADLSGERLRAALRGGVTVVKVSDEELQADGLVADRTRLSNLITAMHRLHEDGAENVLISRSDEPALLLSDGVVSEVHMPKLQIADTSGAGDSMTAGVAATLADGGSILEAVAMGAAAGALNVTRHGLGTGEAAAILRLRDLVTVTPLEEERGASTRVSPSELARRVREE